jgi:hypothetical protein
VGGYSKHETTNQVRKQETNLNVKRTHLRTGMEVRVRVCETSANPYTKALCIPRIRFEFIPPNSSWTIQHVQFPLCLAYATTFHGCVGLTLDKTVLDTRIDVFTHGQLELYTSLSRVRNRTDTRLLRNKIFTPDEDHLHLTTNVVYKNLLL